MTARVAAIDVHGLRALRLVAGDGSSAVLVEQGAQVVSWRTADGRERLYLSPRAQFAPGVAIRGGIPVVFPQFGGAGPLMRHGFARTAPWQLGDAGSDAMSTWAALHLVSSDATRRIWPHDVAATIELRLRASSLELALRVDNTGGDPMSFQAALHTYLAVDRVDSARVWGLQGRPYRDGLTGAALAVQAEPLLAVAGAIDRICLDVPPELALLQRGDTTTLTQQGFRDAVLWNPGPQACAAMADMPADGWQHMLCIEAAAVDPAVVLAPGQRWTGSQRITCAAA